MAKYGLKRGKNFFAGKIFRFHRRKNFLDCL